MKPLFCKDAGMNCDWSTTGKDEKEILLKATEHARTAHGFKELPRDLLGKIRGVIRERAA